VTDLQLQPADEHAHTPQEQRWWGESWYLDFTTEDGTLGGYVRIGLYPNQGRAWYWACLVGKDRSLVTVIDHHVPLPHPGSLEIRTEGLWADHNVEVPFEHMTIGCEAFAVAVEDPAEVYGRLRGDRVPFGLDLEWETVGPGAYPYPGTSRYEIPCRVHGEILVGDERIDFDGLGQRDHSWAVRDWWQFGWVWTAGALEDGTRFHGARIRVPGLEEYTPGYVQAPDGARAEIDRCLAAESTAEHGFPVEASFRCGDLGLAIDPVAFSPVLLVDEYEGRTGRFPRALCRFEADDGRRGVGWTEWNQPSQSDAGAGPDARSESTSGGVG
jgi:hypothetical protein